MSNRSRSAAALVATFFAYAALVAPIRSLAAGAPSDAACAARANDTSGKIVECIRRPALWKHMMAFQKIADENGGNRDTFFPGYRASVAYVASLMKRAGYRVTIQPYRLASFNVVGSPTFETFDRRFAVAGDYFVARLSATGSVTARLQPVGRSNEAAATDSQSGCTPSDFADFVPGRIALIERGGCSLDDKVASAEAARASAVVIFNNAGPSHQGDGQGKTARGEGQAFEAHLSKPATVPIVGVASHETGAFLTGQYRVGRAPTVHLDVRTNYVTDGLDYNVIADSPLGDPNHVVVVEGHLDAIYGAGMLDNASGSTTILELATNLAKTPTKNQLRYVWFGGEELGLLGSEFYTRHLAPRERSRIVFDIDSDVTATPNYDIAIADPRYAHNAKRFPPNVVRDSRIGTDLFEKYFASVGRIAQPAPFGNDGTDSNNFSLAGIPNTGILTDQDCCKSDAEVDLWGGYRGNYDGQIPSFNGGCVDRAFRRCDDLDNTDPDVLEFVSKGFASVTLDLANVAFP